MKPDDDDDDDDTITITEWGWVWCAYFGPVLGPFLGH